MSRLLILTLNVLYASFIWAKPAYQIDLIVFAHKNNIRMSHEEMTSPILPVSKNAIPLLTNSSPSGKPYHLLPISQSQLRDEYYQLNQTIRCWVITPGSKMPPAKARWHYQLLHVMAGKFRAQCRYDRAITI